MPRLIQYSDGGLLYSRVACDPAKTDDLIGRRVEADFRRLGPSQKAPYFRCVA